jgi:4-alpha-glucanotransferase
VGEGATTRTSRADAWGIVDGYVDALGDWHDTRADTRAAVLAAMGVDPASLLPPPAPAVHVVHAGQVVPLPGPGELRLEDGTVLGIDASLPADLPLGYHEFRTDRAAGPLRVIVTPGICHLPEGLRTWGWAIQLPSVRSSASWGVGDLADLRRLGAWSAAELGAGMVLVNPLGAASPVVPLEPSPYYPSSRCYRNPLYLRVEEVPGAGELGCDLEPLAAAGRALNTDRHVHRDRVFELKMAALERLWARRREEDGLRRYCEEQGELLTRFATFCALGERHGAGFRSWAPELRRPGTGAVLRFATDHADRIGFHQWVQWLIDVQLARASTPLRVVHDLPIGVDPGGADAWSWQDLLAIDVSVGAPPDRYVAHGQDWGLPPLIPDRLRAAGYEPFVRTIRAALRHAGGLRIDHVMGLFRLFWVPPGAPPAAGTFVRYPAGDLLGILALESHRAGAVVVGEDLGTVEAGVREVLAAHRVLSYRLLWFETDPPATYPRLSLAAVTTHDLPTIAGLWGGADIRAQAALGLEPNIAGLDAIRARLSAMTGVPEDAPVAEVVLRTHEVLAEAPSVMVTATLDDALGVEERPNMPATTNAVRPNWSIALPASLEAIETDARVRAIARVLRRRDRPAPAMP